VCNYTYPLILGINDNYLSKQKLGSSVSIVSDYGPDERPVEVRSLAEEKEDFSSSLRVQTGSETHPAHCSMSTRGPFPGAKRGRGVTRTMSRTIPPFPLRLHVVLGDCFCLNNIKQLMFVMQMRCFFFEARGGFRNIAKMLQRV
jgi:hypothetical protein